MQLCISGETVKEVVREFILILKSYGMHSSFPRYYTEKNSKKRRNEAGNKTSIQ